MNSRAKVWSSLQPSTRHHQWWRDPMGTENVWLNMPQLTCLETMNSLPVSWVVNIIYVHSWCCNNNINIVVIIYCISQNIVSVLWYKYICMYSIYLTVILILKIFMSIYRFLRESIRWKMICALWTYAPQTLYSGKSNVSTLVERKEIF
jgi:hypothetical protein